MRACDPHKAPGMGELHLDVSVTRLERQFNVKVVKGKLAITYREAPTQFVKTTYVFDGQIGGKPAYAEFEISVGPLEGEQTGGRGDAREEQDSNEIDCEGAHVAVANEGLSAAEVYDALYHGVEGALSAGPLLGLRILC